MALRILLADDSQHAQRDGSRILSELGYEVVTVNNGAAALQELEQSAFDLVVADTSMPGLTGIEICERIRQRPEWANLPVLLALAAFELFDAQQGRRAGADEVIQKPFIPSALERAVQELLSRAGKLPAEPAAVAPHPLEPAPESEPESESEPVPSLSALPDSPPAPPDNDQPEAVEPEPPAFSESTAAFESPTAETPAAQPPAAESAIAEPSAAAEPPAAPLTSVVAEPPPGPGRPRWEIAALEVVSSEALPANPVPHTPYPVHAPSPVPLAMAAAASGPAEALSPPASPHSGTGVAPRSRESAAPPLPAEPDDVLLTAWREAMTAPIATAPQLDLADALNAVDEVLARYLAPIIAGEASEQIASRLRALAR